MRILIEFNSFVYDEYIYLTYTGYYYINCCYTYSFKKDFFNFDLFDDSSLSDVHSNKYYKYNPDIRYNY